MPVKVVVVGLGYVGLPLACLSAKKGFKTTGLDINRKIVDATNAGKSHIKDKVLEKNVAAVKGKLSATTDARVIKDADYVVICVPTPVDEQHLPDLKPLESACNAVAPNLRKGQTIIVESTFYPGPGVGGHCFDGNEFVFAKISGKFGVYKFKNFYDLAGKHFKSQIIEKTKLIPTKNIEVLSFDLNRNESCFMPVTFASKRSYGQSIKISAAGNYSLTVTDKHPMIVADEKMDFAVKFADELNINDKLALNSKLPILNIKKHLDLVGLLPKKGKIRVKPIN